MVDSDDEYERRNRDKFRHERSDYDQREDRRGRDQNRSGWSKQSRDRRDNDRGHRDRRSPARNEGSPQAKRMRRDWDDNFPHYDMPYGPRLHGPPPPMWSPSNDLSMMSHSSTVQNQKGSEVDYPTQPPMMSFKHFLATQDDNITDEDSIKKYNEYKIEFKRDQIKEFFIQHKEEEWFRSKYHPDEYKLRQEEMKASLKLRCDVFMKLLETGLIGSASLDMTSSNELVRLLDSAIILMEGGTEFDLKVLDIPDEAADASASESAPESSEKPEASKEPESMEGEGNQSEEKESQKPKNGEGDGSAIDIVESKSKVPDVSEDKEEGEEEEEEEQNAVETEQVKVIPEEEETSKDTTKEAKPRSLHKTQSIFLRNLVPSITKQEVEAICKRYPGYMRVSIQDPQPERRFARRGWITFDKSVKVKDICWNLNNLRVRDCDMGAIVNRELRQRVRAINGLSVHKSVAKQDVKHAAKIIQSLDNRWKMWEDGKPQDERENQSFGFVTNNPVLKNITDFLVDEIDYEDAALGDGTSKDKDGNVSITIDRDEELLKVLDRMLLYLRIIYSIDYYGAYEYPNEDEMPHRCGIIHARGLNTAAKITSGDVNEWLSSFENKIAPFLNPKFELEDSEAKRLGRKNQEDEVEKFIMSNMQELGKDKWLCPLSGKKFKGPEFVRKHILSKHEDKIEEVKKEVEYFNNYLNDPRRLQLPEHPSSRQVANPLPPPMPPSFMGHHPFYRPPPIYPGVYPTPFSVRGPDSYRGDFRREREVGGVTNIQRRLRADPRAVISYTDLDAPPDVD